VVLHGGLSPLMRFGKHDRENVVRDLVVWVHKRACKMDQVALNTNLT
jgi:hypothetical protein